MGKVEMENYDISNLCAYNSKVYKARNGKTGKLMALKRIRMKNEKDGVSDSINNEEGYSYILSVSYYRSERNQAITEAKA